MPCLSWCCSVTGAIFGDSFPVDNCTVVASPAAANPNITMLSLSKLTSYFVEQHLAECPSPGCLYNSTTMNTAVNFSDCFVVSYGFDLAGSTELRRVSVKMGDATRCANAVPGSQCFVSDQGGSPCLGDGGAPVYCSLNTGEVALYGISASPNRCSPSVTSFSMFPLSP
ncbi:hypothetical protein V1264_012563 [Littorina saxatilis]|uniref:Peptidase S1 domain-containing protein n=1 Tax=Littorina saxatilis TaxID=31220 RepID=A0AAN9BX91_9CAEN